MKSVFDIIGPVMIGPSSSHTAGAARIGRIARSVLGEEPAEANVTLFGSFAETYRGHGTDRAVVGGLLGMDTDDIRIKDALTIAQDEGLKVHFKKASPESGEGDFHPNTAGLVLTGKSGKKIYIEGSSVGGGNIVVTRINEFEVSITGKYNALLVEHADKPGMIGRVTSLLGVNAINIASTKMVRQYKGANNLMVIETDQVVPDIILNKISSMSDIFSVIKTEPV